MQFFLAKKEVMHMEGSGLVCQEAEELSMNHVEDLYCYSDFDFGEFNISNALKISTTSKDILN